MGIWSAARRREGAECAHSLRAARRRGCSPPSPTAPSPDASAHRVTIKNGTALFLMEIFRLCECRKFATRTDTGHHSLHYFSTKS